MSADENTDQAIKAKGLTAPRVLPATIDALLQRCLFITETRPGGTTSTFVHVFLDGKFHLATGKSACVDPANFDADIGASIASKQAIELARDKLWELEGYLLYNMLQPNQASASVSVPDNNGYPLFHCTKAVRAFKIGDFFNESMTGKIIIRPQDTSLPKYEAHPKWVEKHNPQTGGYVVFYADGYVSYSPTEAFEEGYQAVQS